MLTNITILIATAAPAAAPSTAANHVKIKCYGCLGKFAKTNIQRRRKKYTTHFIYTFERVSVLNRVMTSSITLPPPLLWTYIVCSWQWTFTELWVCDRFEHSLHWIFVRVNFFLLLFYSRQSSSSTSLFYTIRGIWMRSMIIQFIKLCFCETCIPNHWHTHKCSINIIQTTIFCKFSLCHKGLNHLHFKKCMNVMNHTN